MIGGIVSTFVESWVVALSLADPNWRQRSGILLLGIAIYATIRGASAKELILRPRRSSRDPILFQPRWYHRLLIVVVGLAGVIAALQVLLGFHWRH